MAGNMVYAPIIIPTLNRVVHLKRCISSLEGNPWAKFTDLYVSVDYPANETHIEGHRDVLAYLDSLKNANGFKSITVFCQKKNLGLLENQFFLIDKLKSAGYDRYIFSEDDNEYSPNFIEFMDKALEFFRGNERVLCICSQSHLYLPIEGNFFYSPWVSVWGCGYWMDKKDKMDETLSRAYFDSIIHSFKKCWRLLKLSPAIYRFFASDILEEVPAMRTKDGGVASIDLVQSIYCINERMYCVYPSIRKERQWGYDGSGDNCGEEQFDPNNTVIDTEQAFGDLIASEKLMEKSIKNNEIFKKARNYPGKIKLFRSFLIIAARRILNDKGFTKFKKYIQNVHMSH